MLDYTIQIWWQRLSEGEQNVLIELLYKLNLEEHVNHDECGTILSLK
jgi:hypothetical protein